MDRAQAQERGAANAGIARGAARIGVAADAEVVRRAQAVELRGEAPIPRALVGIGGGAPATLRRRDDPGFRFPLAERHGEPVVARRQGRQLDTGFISAGDRRPPLPREAALVDEAPRHGAVRLRGLKRDRGGTPRFDRVQRRDEPEPDGFDLREAARDLVVIACREAQGGDHAAPGLDIGRHGLAERVGIARCDAEEVGQAFEIAAHRAAPVSTIPVQVGSSISLPV